MIAILDFGSQYTKIIARKIRESNVYCEVFPTTVTLDELKNRRVRGIILSGGPNSVFEKNAPQCDTSIFDAKPDNLEIFRYFRTHYFNKISDFYKDFYKMLNKDLQNFYRTKQKRIKKTRLGNQNSYSDGG